MSKFRPVSALVAATMVASAFSPSCAYKREPDFQGDLNPSTTYKTEFYGGPNQWPPHAEVYTQRFVWKMKYVADQLTAKVKASGRENTVALMTTLVPVDDIYKSTSFGRVCAEQLMTEMDKQGIKVIEARKTEDYLIKDHNGEFALSRDLKRIGAQFSADAVLVGTYAKSKDQMLINVRLVDLKDSGVIAAASTMMDLRGDKFLSAVLMDEDKKNGERETGPVQIRKRVEPLTDPYAEVLQGMIRSMAEKVSETSPAGALGARTIAITTFVDANHVYRTNTFGKYVSEQLINELSSLGYNVVELRAMPEIFVDVHAGELELSREMSRVMANRGAEAVIVGTYTKAGDHVIVNGRFINAKSHVVTGVGELIVDASQRNKFVTGLLEKEVTTVMPAETVEGY